MSSSRILGSILVLVLGSSQPGSAIGLPSRLFLDPPVVGDNRLARAVVIGTGGCLGAELTGVQVEGNAITINGVIPDCECNCLVPVDFAFAAEFGPLEPGLYSVRAQIAVEGGDFPPIEYGEIMLEVIDEPDVVALQGGRFEVGITWRSHGGKTGVAQPVAGRPSDDSALFTFFDRENWEVMVKLIDGCAFNNYWWVFGAAATDVEYTITVTDTDTGAQWTYTNPLGTQAPAITDTSAFDCP